MSRDCQVYLGFAEDQLPWLLTNRFFPSKIGGKLILLCKSNTCVSQQ